MIDDYRYAITAPGATQILDRDLLAIFDSFEQLHGAKRWNGIAVAYHFDSTPPIVALTFLDGSRYTIDTGTDLMELVIALVEVIRTIGESSGHQHNSNLLREERITKEQLAPQLVIAAARSYAKDHTPKRRAEMLAKDKKNETN